ncbi:hypothetical protein KPZU09_10590 [Klebsiella pneumoniae]|uniref:Uncharacterized protein n=1 Tax=Klebsiella pneumoniae TaxID=573 RepID=A0A919HPW6_KLEPN|nr:hypothetical protein KPZU09_10590 [Klebsiella pneumoniae]
MMVQKIKGRGMVDALSLMPAALPGVVVGVGLILLWNQPFWPRSPYNTLWMLLLSYCCLLLPGRCAMSAARCASWART